MNRTATIDGVKHEDANRVDSILSMAIMEVMDQMEKVNSVHLIVSHPQGWEPFRSTRGMTPLERAVEDLRALMQIKNVKQVDIEVTA